MSLSLPRRFCANFRFPSSRSRECDPCPWCIEGVRSCRGVKWALVPWDETGKCDFEKVRFPQDDLQLTPIQVRKIVSDFAVLLAIVTMTAFDHSMNLETPKLIVPDEITPTRADRGWIRDTKSCF